MSENEQASRLGGSSDNRSPSTTAYCGDCRSTVSVNLPAEGLLKPADYYCPRCVRAVSAPINCPRCGSTICSDCGTPLELADELGIG